MYQNQSAAACERELAVGSRVQVVKGELAELDGKEITVLLSVADRCRVLGGTGRYERSENEGNTLRIELHDADDQGSPAFILDEDEWDGRIIPDIRYGCDYCIEIEVKVPAGVNVSRTQHCLR